MIGLTTIAETFRDGCPEVGEEVLTTWGFGGIVAKIDWERYLAAIRLSTGEMIWITFEEIAVWRGRR